MHGQKNAFILEASEGEKIGQQHNLIGIKAYHMHHFFRPTQAYNIESWVCTKKETIAL